MKQLGQAALRPEVASSVLSSEGRRGLSDLFFFCTWFLGLDLEEEPHRMMTSALQECVVNPKKPFTMLVVPRDCFKTTIVKATAIWIQLREIYLYDNVYHRTLIATATLALGKSILNSIIGILKYGGKNHRLTEHFGELWMPRSHAGSSRTDEGIMLAPRIRRGEIATIQEPNFFLGSLRRISTGFHADSALIDDLNNEDNVSTDLQRKKTHSYWRLLFPILGSADAHGKQARVMFTCTPWHDDDVRGLILREEEEAKAEDPTYVSPWNAIHRSCYNEDGTAFFPTRYPLERLAFMKARMGTREFAANYECDPVGDNGFVKEDQIRFTDREMWPTLNHGRIAVDPNQHKDAMILGCYAAVVVAAYDRFGKMYVQEAMGGREWDTMKLIDVLFALQEEYPKHQIIIEEIHMAHFQAALMLEEVNRGIRLRVNWSPVPPNLSKYDKWSRMETRFRQGFISFSDHIALSIKTEIKNELIRGTAARFKDFLDALAIADSGFRPRVVLQPTDAEKNAQNAGKPQGNVVTFEKVFPGMFR